MRVQPVALPWNSRSPQYIFGCHNTWLRSINAVAKWQQSGTRNLTRVCAGSLLTVPSTKELLNAVGLVIRMEMVMWLKLLLGGFVIIFGLLTIRDPIWGIFYKRGGVPGLVPPGLVPPGPVPPGPVLPGLALPGPLGSVRPGPVRLGPVRPAPCRRDLCGRDLVLLPYGQDLCRQDSCRRGPCRQDPCCQDLRCRDLCVPCGQDLCGWDLCGRPRVAETCAARTWYFTASVFCRHLREVSPQNVYSAVFGRTKFQPRDEFICVRRPFCHRHGLQYGSLRIEHRTLVYMACL